MDSSPRSGSGEPPEDTRLSERATRRRILAEPDAGEQSDKVVLICLDGPSVGRIYRLETLATLIGRADEAHVQICDTCVSRRHAVITFDAEVQGYRVSDLGSENGTRVNGTEVRTDALLHMGDKIDVAGGCLLRVSSAQDGETRFAAAMLEATRLDPLTGTYNRRYLDERLEAEVSYAVRHGGELSLLLADLDHFKRVNDTHGHPVGDALLVQLGAALGELVRTEDVLARYGGEEFALVCRGTDESGACKLADRIRGTIATLSVAADGGPARTTASVGVASMRSHRISTASLLVEAADRALYLAKQTGRDRVVSFAEVRASEGPVR